MLRRFSVFLLIAPPVFRLCAQQFGEITGTATDASGAIVAGAHGLNSYSLKYSF